MLTDSNITRMKHSVYIIVIVMLCGLTANAQSANDPIVIDCQNHTVTPYGRAQIFKITDVKLNVKMVTLTYELENPMTEKPVLIANYTEGNIACGTRGYHYHGKSVTQYTYTMTDNAIKFVPSPQGFVSGNVLVTIFLMGKEDLQEPYMAMSNVVSLRMDF